MNGVTFIGFYNIGSFLFALTEFFHVILFLYLRKKKLNLSWWGCKTVGVIELLRYLFDGSTEYDN